MGNCIGHHRRAASWADDEEEWTSSETGGSPRSHIHGINYGEEKMEELLKPSSATEVKIRITKKQLDELLRMVNVKGLPIQHVLQDLLSQGGHEDDESCGLRDSHGSNWRPALQSIPEVSE